MPQRIVYLIVALCLSVGLSVGQSKSKRVRSLERQRNDLQTRIERTSRDLETIKRTSRAEEKQLKLVQQQVVQRQEMIKLIGNEMQALEHVIDSLGQELVVLRGRETRLLNQYAQSIRAMHRRNADADKLLFLLSAKSLDEAMLRQRFLSRYAKATSQATTELRAVRTQIEAAQAEVNQSHEQKAHLLTLREKERRQLEVEQGKRQTHLRSLEGQAKELTKSLAQQRREAQQLEAKIQAQIEAEIAAAEKAARRAREARERRRNTPPKPASVTPSNTQRDETQAKEQEEREERIAAVRGGYAMNAEERKLSGSFSGNKGRLPMPIRGRYDLVRRFGLQQHSTQSKVQINSGGIDLRAYNDLNVYAVYNGVVSRVFMTPGYGQSVIVRHGNYLTVYSNLAQVRVGAGDRIATGQVIGSIGTSGDQGRRRILHFQIWHERTKLNPEQWIHRS